MTPALRHAGRALAAAIEWMDRRLDDYIGLLLAALAIGTEEREPAWRRWTFSLLFVLGIMAPVIGPVLLMRELGWIAP